MHRISHELKGHNSTSGTLVAGRYVNSRQTVAVSLFPVDQAAYCIRHTSRIIDYNAGHRLSGSLKLCSTSFRECSCICVARTRAGWRHFHRALFNRARFRWWRSSRDTTPTRCLATIIAFGMRCSMQDNFSVCRFWPRESARCPKRNCVSFSPVSSPGRLSSTICSHPIRGRARGRSVICLPVTY